MVFEKPKMRNFHHKVVIFESQFHIEKYKLQMSSKQFWKVHIISCHETLILHSIPHMVTIDENLASGPSTITLVAVNGVAPTIPEHSLSISRLS